MTLDLEVNEVEVKVLTSLAWITARGNEGISMGHRRSDWPTASLASDGVGPSVISSAARATFHGKPPPLCHFHDQIVLSPLMENFPARALAQLKPWRSSCKIKLYAMATFPAHFPQNRFPALSSSIPSLSSSSLSAAHKY